MVTFLCIAKLFTLRGQEQMRERAGYLEIISRGVRLSGASCNDRRVKKQPRVLGALGQCAFHALLGSNRISVRILRPGDGVVREHIGPRGKLLECESEGEGGLLATHGQK